MDHRRPSRNPWLPLLLLVSVVLVVLSCALHATADCSTEIGTEQTDSGKGGDCHGRNHTHSHGHHGGDSGGKDKPGTTTPAAASNSNNNPWVLTAGAAPRLQAVSGFTAATGIIVLITGAVVSWSLATY